MRIIFVNDFDDCPSGTVSQASWDNPQVKEAMNVVFRVQPHEEITEVYVTPEGLRAIFKFKDQPKEG